MKADFSRTELLIGSVALRKLAEVTICVAGLGGVGSYAVESLARAGVRNLVIIDFDLVGPTNVNRQLLALQDTIGLPKIQVMEERLNKLNPDISVVSHQVFLDSENRAAILADSDIIIDAIDSLGPKIGMLEDLSRQGRSVISVMGAGNRLDPTQIRIAPLSHTEGCPLARRVRKFLRRRGIKLDFPCVYSTEAPLVPDPDVQSEEELILTRGRQRTPIGSISYIPAIMGIMAASWVIRKVIGTEDEH